MHFITRALFGLFLLFGFAQYASAVAPSQEILGGILSQQGVSDQAMIDCAKVSPDQAEAYGEAFFTEQIDTGSKEYQDLLVGFPKDKFTEIYRGMGLQSLGCTTVEDMASTTPVMLVGNETTGERLMAPTAPTQNRTPSPNRGNMSFIATWTTIVWMFSALGFAVFMIWITSSKFRLQFRKMAEGDYDQDDTAISILKERFARGEITKGEFESMKREIRN